MSVEDALNVEIRQAGHEDTHELARLRWDFSPDEVAASGQSFAEFAAAFDVFLQRTLERRDWAIWVAEQDGRIVANIWVEIVERVPRPGKFGKRYGYVTNVYTTSELRGRGIGSALMQRVIDWAQEAGLGFLIVWPSEESRRFYERAGFVRDDEILHLTLEED